MENGERKKRERIYLKPKEGIPNIENHTKQGKFIVVLFGTFILEEGDRNLWFCYSFDTVITSLSFLWTIFIEKYN